MKFKRKRRLTKPEATTGLSAVKSVQIDMKKLQQMLAEAGPHFETMAGLSSRIKNLEELVGRLATELAELKTLAERFVAKTEQ